jgi:pimeloyl-ACP methyl ester carboxylesterase
MHDLTKAEPQPAFPRLSRALALSAVAGLSLAGCGGSDNNNNNTGAATTPQFAANVQTCEALAGKTIEASLIGEPTTGAVVTSASYKTAVADAPNQANNAIVQATPDHCQLLVDIKPVDPTAPVIKSQVDLPTIWNEKKLQFGGSGFNGVLQNPAQASRNAGPEIQLPLTQGYMTAGTDSGHQVPTGGDLFAFALNNEALANFGYASYKKTHDVAVQLGLLYYGKKPAKSYYMGGSEGGREGMMMAQRYPADYDGIVSIDPVMNWSGLQTFGNYVGGILQSAPNGWLNGKAQLVHDTVVAACDALDGIADGVVSNYKACKAPADAALAAKRCASGGDDGATCLSSAQLAVINAAHTGYKFNFPLANGMTAYAGFGYGGEALPGNWSTWMTGTVSPTAGPAATGIPQLYQYGNGYVRYFIAQNKDFNPLTYDPNNFQARVQQVSTIMDATNPDLTPFFNRGGKLILREDLSDTAQSPFTGLNYWDAVVTKMGKQTVDQFFAAYTATGLPHTSGGISAGTTNAPAYGIPGRVDLLASIENWVEKGVKPVDQLVLTNRQALPPYAVVTTKPLCRYPLYPKYVGTNPAGGNQAENFTCASN